MSSSLARLREYFGDPLLITRSGKSVLSPLAQTLATRFPRCSGPLIGRSSLSRRLTRVLIAGVSAFWRQIRSSRDFLQKRCSTSLNSRPISVWMSRRHTGPVGAAGRRPCRFDHCSRGSLFTDHPKESLLEEDHRVIACRKTFAPDVLTLEQYAAADHVEVFVGASRIPYLPEHLFSAHGFTRRISVKLDNFSLVPFFLSVRSVLPHSREDRRVVHVFGRSEAD